MGKGRRVKPMFSLSPVWFRNSSISGRGVFARRRFDPGEVIVAYAPKQRRVDANSQEARDAAATRLTLLSDDRFVIIPDTTTPGGWLTNHSCSPNAAIYSSGEGRIQCTRSIAPGEEVTVFYGWVTQNEPERDPCRCGAPNCRRFINFDLNDDDARRASIIDGRVIMDDVLKDRLAQYGKFLRTIGQEQVMENIANTLVRVALRAAEDARRGTEDDGRGLHLQNPQP